ncbi:hypothetical protein PIB30_063869 [Stylosanthes scabra]|uniref:Uncharacterized protein n=1 Tax=Stylosanthes scabra TaxID=79078 RepID=A0ABU6SMS0_9FABA|nr:hypothetical protein [Stylosanthes scabra]
MAKNLGVTTEKIEEAIEKTIRNLMKGKYVAMEEDNGPGPLNQAGANRKEYKQMDKQPKDTPQINKNEGAQRSDEANSPVSMEMMKKGEEAGKTKDQQHTDEKEKSPNTIGELIRVWNGQWTKEGYELNREGNAMKNGKGPTERVLTLGQATRENITSQEIIAQEEGNKNKGMQLQMITREGGGVYYVELADEENEDTQGKIEMEWERNLAMEISSNNMHIKRRRKEQAVLMIKDKEEEESQEKEDESAIRKRMRKEEDNLEADVELLEWKVQEDDINNMAEEAGQYKPHQAP